MSIAIMLIGVLLSAASFLLPFFTGMWWQWVNRDIIRDSRKIHLPNDTPIDTERRQLEQLIFVSGTRLGMFLVIFLQVAIWIVLSFV